MHLTAPLRPALWLLVAGGLLVAAVDGGSVALTRVTAPDATRAAGRTAAAAVEGMEPSRQAVELAYQTAEQAARLDGLEVRKRDFALYPDGRITLTATRTAPTLLLDRVDALRHLAEVRTTVTVSPLPYS